MPRCIDCKKIIRQGERCEKHSKLNYRKEKKTFKVINCPHENKNSCTNNSQKGFNNPQALKMHIFHKHKDLTIADKLESKGIETTTEKPKEEPIMPKEKKEPETKPEKPESKEIVEDLDEDDGDMFE